MLSVVKKNRKNNFTVPFSRMAKKVKQVQEKDMAKQYNLKGQAPEKRMSM